MQRTEPRPPLSSPLDPILWVALSVAGAATALLWLTGQAAAGLFHHDWLPVGLVAMGRILLQFPHHLNDPKLAWPEQLQPLLPGPVGFYATLVLVVVAVAAAVGFGWRFLTALWEAFRLRPGTGPHPANTGLRRRHGLQITQSSWATAGQLRRLLAPVGAGRTTLGLLGRRRITTEPGQSTILIGPQQSGKTTTKVIRDLLERRRGDGPAVVIAAKPNLFVALPHLRTLGKVHVLDVTGASNVESTCWTPLSYCRTYRQAREMAAWLIEASKPPHHQDRSTDSGLWDPMGVSLVGPFLYGAALDGRTMAQVLSWLARFDGTPDGVGEVGKILESYAGQGHDQAGLQAALDEYDFVGNLPERQQGSVYMTAKAALEVFADPGVAERTARDLVQVDRMLEGDNTLFIYAPPHEQKRLRPLVLALLGQVFRTATAMAASGRPVPGYLLALLDDAYSVASPTDLPELASTGVESRIQLVTIFHDFSQLLARYGEAWASVVNNHRAKLFMGGQTDQFTLEQLSGLIGAHRLPDLQHTTSPDGQRSVTETGNWRPIAAGDVLRQLGRGKSVLLYDNLPPALLDMVPWHLDGRLRDAQMRPRHLSTGRR